MKSRLTFKSFSKRAKWVLYPTVALVLVNFFIFIGVSQYIGGDALDGHINAGKYFLCAHGSCTQVSPQTWRYSYWHTITAMGGIFLSLAEIALFITTGDVAIDWDAT